MEATRSPLTTSRSLRWFDRFLRAVTAVFAIGTIAFVVPLPAATRRVVRTARDGEPFDARNVGRLRLLAALFVAVPAGAALSGRVLSSTVDADPRLHISIPTPDWGVFLVVALGLLALAEVFKEGVARRDLERTTI